MWKAGFNYYAQHAAHQFQRYQERHPPATPLQTTGYICSSKDGAAFSFHWFTSQLSACIKLKPLIASLPPPPNHTHNYHCHTGSNKQYTTIQRRLCCFPSSYRLMFCLYDIDHHPQIFLQLIQAWVTYNYFIQQSDDFCVWELKKAASVNMTCI